MSRATSVRAQSKLVRVSRNNAGLTAEGIVVEALRIIDGQGLRRLTMRRLGDTLGVEAMAIYHHFPLGKEQLFDAIVEHVTDVSPRRGEGRDGDEGTDADGDAERQDRADEPGEDPSGDPGEGEDPGVDDRPWPERLRSWAEDYRVALLRHAGALPLLINRRADTPAALRSTELLYAAFTEAGLAGARVREAAATLESYVLGAVLREVRARAVPSPDAATLDGRFPLVVEVWRHASEEPDFEAEFRAGLDTFLGALGTS